MEIGRRKFISNTAMIGVATATAPLILLPKRVEASPLLFGVVIAAALFEIFKSHGLTKEHVKGIANAEAQQLRKAPETFHNYFDDDISLNHSSNWRFENGKIIGVNGKAYGDTIWEHPNSSKSLLNQKGAYNKVELEKIKDPKTRDDFGALLPSSLRMPCLEEHEEKLRKQVAQMNGPANASKLIVPQYARQFTKFDTDETVVGIFGIVQNEIFVAWT